MNYITFTVHLTSDIALVWAYFKTVRLLYTVKLLNTLKFHFIVFLQSTQSSEEDSLYCSIVVTWLGADCGGDGGRGEVEVGCEVVDVDGLRPLGPREGDVGQVGGQGDVLGGGTGWRGLQCCSTGVCRNRFWCCSHARPALLQAVEHCSGWPKAKVQLLALPPPGSLPGQAGTSRKPRI